MSEAKIREALGGRGLVDTGPADEIDLRELWLVIWSGKWFIIGVTLVFAIGSVLSALSKPNVYTATALLAPASSSSSSSISKLAGRFGGLASLAGVNLAGGAGGDKTAIAIELIKTWGFLEGFIKSNGLEVEVYAVKGWDKSTGKLIVDGSLYDDRNQEWVSDSKEEGDYGGPTSWELFEEIESKISVGQDKKTGLIYLSVEHYSPIVAKQWVDLLVAAINRHIQSEDRKDALNSITYLKEQVNKTSVSEMQTVFYQLIEEQVKTLMLAEISDEYVFKTLSPAKVAEEKTKPRRALFVIVGVLLGGMLSVFFVIVRYFLSKGR